MEHKGNELVQYPNKGQAKITKLKRKEAMDPRYKKQYWRDNDKVQAVSTYLMLGNLAQTAVVTGIPYKTLLSWKNAMPWWKEIALKLQAEDLQQLDSNLQRVVGKALKALEDRIDMGDVVYDSRTGKVARIPVKAQTALNITKELTTKREVIAERQHGAKEEVEKTIDDRLLKLAAEFARFTNPDTKPKALDVPMVEVVTGNDQA